MATNVTWLFDDGITKHPSTTFPYAFRMMHSKITKANESGKPIQDIDSKFKIIGPTGLVYPYAKANELAVRQGLLKMDGTLEAREFKKDKRLS